MIPPTFPMYAVQIVTSAKTRVYDNPVLLTAARRFAQAIREDGAITVTLVGYPETGTGVSLAGWSCALGTSRITHETPEGHPARVAVERWAGEEAGVTSC